MKHDTKRIFLAAAFPLFVLLILYIIKLTEFALDVNFYHLGIYPLKEKGLIGILTHPLIHSGFKHLLANTITLFFLSWCLFYFYRDLGYLIFLCIWIGAGIFTFFIGKTGWHMGASGVIYGLAFFLFFSGLMRRHKPLIAISLLVTFLYGSLVWQMFPHFTASNVSWEGHLGGAIAGVICAMAFLKYGPQRPAPAVEEDEEDEEEDESFENDYVAEYRYDSDLALINYREDKAAKTISNDMIISKASGDKS